MVEIDKVERIEILGTPVVRVTYRSAFEIIQDFAREARPTAVCPSNTHILSEARHDPSSVGERSPPVGCSDSD